MTCNIRTSTALDGEDHWERRKVFCVSVILGREPDVFGVQEAHDDGINVPIDESPPDSPRADPEASRKRMKPSKDVA